MSYRQKRVKQPHSLFITYNGALEPLIQSQGLPYLKGLTEKGIKVSLLSFEKREYRRQKQEIARLEEELFRQPDIHRIKDKNHRKVVFAH